MKNCQKCRFNEEHRNEKCADADYSICKINKTTECLDNDHKYFQDEIDKEIYDASMWC